MVSSTVHLLLSISFFAFAIYLRAELRVQRRERLKQEIHQQKLLFEKDYHARLEAMQSRLTKYEQEKQSQVWNRITELSEKQQPTLAERRELSWMKAEQREHGECGTHYELPDLIGLDVNPIQPYHPADWITAEKQGMTANAGTIFHVLTSPLIGYPFRRASSVLVRVNQSCPWRRLLIIHEDGSNIQDITHQHLPAFTAVGSMAPPAPQGARWDPEMHEWYIPNHAW